MKILIIIFMISTNVMAQDSKYSPGFSFWTQGVRVKVTLIEQFRPWDDPNIKDNVLKLHEQRKTGNESMDSLSLKQQIDFLSKWLWLAKFEEHYGGSIGTVSTKGQIDEVSIDLATGKAFQWRGNGGKVIYFDDIEGCVTEFLK